jgi:cobalamin-dependent methionine synthase-like protein
MRRIVTWSPATSGPVRSEVLALQGLPPGADPSPRVASLFEDALAAYRATADPRAAVASISAAEFADVYRGDGSNAPSTPLETIFPNAGRLALFVATLGGGVTDRIRDLFEANMPALAAMLDSVASAAVDGLASRLGTHSLMTDDARAGDWRTLAYSPGYCGWHVSGQRALFAFLGPEEIGVTLRASGLMEPLKSVSGVLVAGPDAIHRFSPRFSFCADCREKPCRHRIAALSRGTSGT